MDRTVKFPFVWTNVPVKTMIIGRAPNLLKANEVIENVRYITPMNLLTAANRLVLRPPPERGRALAALGAISLAAALGGCGSSNTPTLNTAAVERAIATSVLNESHVYTLVSCPQSVPQQQGKVFTCQAHLKVGSYPVSVTEVDGKGHVHYGNSRPLVVLKMGNVTHAIGASILAQRKLHAQVSCPTDVLQEKGLTFTCTAKVAGRSYPFTVTEVDGKGHVTYVGH